MPVPLRKPLFWLHLTAAIGVGLVILAMALTGLLLSFEAQIQGWADRDSRYVEPAAGSPPLPVQTLLETIREQRPELGVSSITVRRDPREAVVLALGRDAALFLDPYRGVVTGAGSASFRRGFRAVTEIHRFLAAQGDARALGKAATGFSNLLFLGILASGLYIWLPRALNLMQLRNSLWFRAGLAGKARDFNWHHVLGIWALVPLLLIVASALPISYSWAGNLLQSLTGSPPTPPRAAADAGNAANAGNASRPVNGPAASSSGPGSGQASPLLAELDLAGLGRVVAAAQGAAPAWQSLTVRLPAQPDGTLNVTVDGSARRGRPDLRAQLAIQPASGEIVKHGRFAEQDRGRRVRSWMRWIHTGEAGGLAGQAVGALACAAVLVLGWTGYALAYRRLVSWLRSRPVRALGVAAAASKPRAVPRSSRSVVHFPPEVDS